MKKTVIAALLVVCLCLLPGCGPGTAEGRGFDTLEEFVAVFGQAVALPTYYPEGFDPREPGNGTFDGIATFSAKGWGKRRVSDSLDNYSYVGVSVTRDIDTSAGVKKQIVRFGRNLEGIVNYDKYEEIPSHPYGGKMRTSYYIVHPGTITTGYGWHITVAIEYDGAPYAFFFSYSIISSEEEGRKYELEEELKEWSIKEATLMYESLEYWK